MIFDFFGLLFEKNGSKKLYYVWFQKSKLNCARTFEMLTVAFSESTVSRTQVQLCYNRFKEDREDVNDDARPGRPSMSTADENIEAVKKMILHNHRITISC